MHKIFDLKEMEIEQLHALANELQIKGFKKMDKEALVYAILDEEARKNALNASERPDKPRRGRPRKSEKPAAVQSEPKEVVKETEKKEEPKTEKSEAKKETPGTAAEQKPQPKKRGRKPKNAQAQEPAEAPASETVEIKSAEPAEKSADSLIEVPLCVTSFFFFLDAFKILSLYLTSNSLNIMCHSVGHFRFFLFELSELSRPRYLFLSMG